MTTLPNTGLTLLASGQSQKEVVVAETQKLFDALIQGAVESRTTSTPPGSPAEGDRYIVASGGTGDWSGEDTNLAYYFNAEWNFYTPVDGWTFFVRDEDKYTYWDGSVWTESVVSGGFFFDHGNAAVAVVNRTDTAPPGSPTDGDMYIPQATATGAWAGQENTIAGYDGTEGAWVFRTPVEGDMVWVKDEDILIRYDGSAWVGNPVTVGTFVSGLPTAGANGLVYVAPVAFELPSGLSGSQAYAVTTSTGAKSFDIQKNGASQGSVDFAIGTNAATFTFASAVQFAAGDRLHIVTPTPQDATLADVAISLKGYLV